MGYNPEYDEGYHGNGGRVGPGYQQGYGNEDPYHQQVENEGHRGYQEDYYDAAPPPPPEPEYDHPNPPYPRQDSGPNPGFARDPRARPQRGFPPMFQGSNRGFIPIHSRGQWAPRFGRGGGGGGGGGMPVRARDPRLK